MQRLRPRLHGRLRLTAAALGSLQDTFIAKRNPRQGLRNWFWSMECGERIRQPAPSGVVDFIVSHDLDAGMAEPPAVLCDGPKPRPESVVKITDLIAALERIKAKHGT